MPSLIICTSYFGISLIIIKLYLYLKGKSNYWKIRNVPHRKPTIFFGHFLDLFLSRQSPAIYFRNLYEEFQAPCIGILSFLDPVILIKDLNIIKTILTKDFHKFEDRMAIVDENIDPILANGLLGVKGYKKWKCLRNKLTPFFTSGKLKVMINLIKECGEDLVKYIDDKTDNSLDVKETVEKFTTDVISSCAFGINANSFKSEKSDLQIAGKKLVHPTLLQTLKALSYFMVPNLSKLFKFPFIDPNATSFFRKVFNETIEKREESNARRNDLIDTLIDLKNEESDDNDFKFYGDRLVAQAILFFGAGHETTSSLISFTVYELCIHTDIQDRLRDEIEDCILKHGDLTYEAILDMKYLAMVVSETLRKYPLAPFSTRVCSEDYKISETGLKIEKDTLVILTYYGIHMNPKYFPNPETFDPDRFNDENKKNIVPDAYLPFGNGPRRCIGGRFGLLNSKLGLIYLLRNFKIHRNSLTQEFLVFSPSGIANVEGGINVTFSKLQNL